MILRLFSNISKKIIVCSIICFLFLLFTLRLYIDNRIYLLTLLKDQKCWREYFIREKSNHNLVSYVNPATIDEAPVGHVPSVPKAFLIEEKDFCKRRNLKVIAYVHSAIKSVEDRRLTRETWVSYSDSVGTVFMVGRAKNNDEQKIVDEESAKYHDIVQGNYTDLYQLLTYKALNSMHWLMKNCKHVPWVMHADDDILVDIKMLFSMIHTYERKKRHNEIFCYTYERPVVNRDGKWLITKKEYPCSTFPVYCAGPMWFTSMNVINKLYNHIPRVKYIWIDDTYLTGLLAEESGIKRTHLHMEIHHLNETDLGRYVAWLNLLSNRTSNWQSMISHYRNDDNAT